MRQFYTLLFSGISLLANINSAHAEDILPLNLQYTNSSALYTKGASIALNSPSSTGGAVRSYSISPILPAGLMFSTSTGVISGKPTVTSPLANYTIKAMNLAGSTQVNIQIRVQDSAPAGLTYSSPSASYARTVAIVPNVPSSTGGAVTSYSISPALPSGLILNTTNGVISGTPTVMIGLTTFTVVGKNGTGQTQRGISIRVDDAPPAGLKYSTPTAVYGNGVKIANNVPSSTAGAITSYTVAPTLPSGLTLSPSTGVIYGTPTALSAKQTYVITGASRTGSTTSKISIEVLQPALSTDPFVSSLLSQREGYGRNTTGGLGGYYAEVTSDLDDGSAGTLRSVINLARTRPTWITFSRDMTINFPIKSYPIGLPSNITIDGRGRNILIQGPGFTISGGKSNIIITNLSMNGQSCNSNGYCHTDPANFNPYSSGIRVEAASSMGVDANTGLRIWSESRSRDIWLNHLDISNYPDKLIAIAKGGTAITISHSRLFASKYGLLVGNDFDAAVDDNGNGSQNAAMCNPLAVQSMQNLEGSIYVTVHHTIFASVTQRNPRVTSNAKLHMYNNVLFSWSVNAVSAQATSQVIAEANLFFNHSYRACDGMGYPEIGAGMSYTNFCPGIPGSNHNLFQNALSTNFYPTNGYAQWCPYGEVPGSLYGYIQALENVYALDGAPAYVQHRYPANASPSYPSIYFLGFESELRGHINYSTPSLQSGPAFLNQAQQGINEVYAAGEYNVYPVMNATGNRLYFPSSVGNLLREAGNL